MQRSRRGVAGLSHSELQELGLLYRQTASDLAAAREDATSKQLATYLNQLLGRGHNLIYMGHKPKISGIVRFYLDTYPQAFRETLPQTLLALAIFAVTGLAGWIVTVHDPGFAHRLLGTHMMETIEQRKMWTDSIVTVKPVASSGIMTNNLSVAFSSFALGITAGLGTIWMMIMNGLLIGVIGAATWRAGMAVQLWSFVALARGMLFPGLLPRRESLARAGGRAARLLLGTIPLLVIAGLIEGFYSPSNAPVAMKFAFAAVLFVALLTYLFRFRRLPSREATAGSSP